MKDRQGGMMIFLPLIHLKGGGGGGGGGIPYSASFAISYIKLLEFATVCFSFIVYHIINFYKQQAYSRFLFMKLKTRPTAGRLFAAR